MCGVLCPESLSNFIYKNIVWIELKLSILCLDWKRGFKIGEIWYWFSSAPYTADIMKYQNQVNHPFGLKMTEIPCFENYMLKKSWAFKFWAGNHKFFWMRSRIYVDKCCSSSSNTVSLFLVIQLAISQWEGARNQNRQNWYAFTHQMKCRNGAL